MGVNVSDRLTADGKRFQKMLKEMAELEVCIGFQHGKATEDDGTDICDIAAWNELGTEHIPARPFLRKSVDENKDKIDSFLQARKADLLSGVSVEHVLKEIGNFQKGLVQDKITEGHFQKNADVTINGGWIYNKKTGKSFYVKGKKSTKPLIDTGRMRQAVDYIVRKKEGGS